MNLKLKLSPNPNHVYTFFLSLKFSAFAAFKLIMSLVSQRTKQQKKRRRRRRQRHRRQQKKTNDENNDDNKNNDIADPNLKQNNNNDDMKEDNNHNTHTGAADEFIKLVSEICDTKKHFFDCSGGEGDARWLVEMFPLESPNSYKKGEIYQIRSLLHSFFNTVHSQLSNDRIIVSDQSGLFVELVNIIFDYITIDLNNKLVEFIYSFNMDIPVKTENNFNNFKLYTKEYHNKVLNHSNWMRCFNKVRALEHLTFDNRMRMFDININLKDKNWYNKLDEYLEKTFVNNGIEKFEGPALMKKMKGIFGKYVGNGDITSLYSLDMPTRSLEYDAEEFHLYLKWANRETKWDFDLQEKNIKDKRLKNQKKFEPKYRCFEPWHDRCVYTFIVCQFAKEKKIVIFWTHLIQT